MNPNNIQEFLEKRFNKDPNFVYRRIVDECLLVPIRHQVADLTYIYVLNPVGERIWELIDGQRRMGDIKDQLSQEFEVSPHELAQDLLEFLAQLEEIGSVREA